MIITPQYVGYIYGITNKVTGKKYIGQTSTSIDIRYSEHLRCARVHPNSPCLLYRAIQKYGEDSFTIEQLDMVKSDSRVSLKNKLNEKEIYYIDKFNSYKPNGYNMTKGGGAFADHVLKSVFKVDENGIVLDRYESIREASRSTGIDEKSIGHACKTTSHYSSGCYWYPNECNIHIGQNLGRQSRGRNNWRGHITYLGKPVKRYSKEGVYIDTFISASDAARKLKISQAYISKCCRGLAKTAGGYRWSF